MLNLQTQRWVCPLVPSNTIDAMVQIEKLSEEDVKRDPRLKKTREAWIASNYLLFRTEVDAVPWYLRKNTIEDSVDDIYGASFYEEDGKAYSSGEIAIQTFEIREESGPLIEAISKKFKHDLKNVALVGYVMRDEELIWSQIVSELSKITHSAQEIVLIGNVGKGNFIVSRVFPEIKQRVINARTYDWNYKRVVESKRVLRPEDSGATYVGKVLITPDLSIEDDKTFPS